MNFIFNYQLSQIKVGLLYSLSFTVDFAFYESRQERMFPQKSSFKIIFCFNNFLKACKLNAIFYNLTQKIFNSIYLAEFKMKELSIMSFS